MSRALLYPRRAAATACPAAPTSSTHRRMGRATGTLLAVAALLYCNGIFMFCEAAKHTEGEVVHVSMNKVWPYNNPTETYSYYDKLPVCHPGNVESEPMTFGQIMRGDRLVNSLYKINFEVSTEPKAVCERQLTTEQAATFRHAIDQNYVFEIYVADLPIHKPLGLKRIEPNGDTLYFLGTSMDFMLGHNGGMVVSADMQVDRTPLDITNWRTEDAKTVTFTYSVNWFESSVTTHGRLHAQLAGALTASTQAFDIHWLAIINSFVLVLFIVSLLVVVTLRVVRSDLARYFNLSDEEMSFGVEEETGWKLLRADVFRPPPHRMWFCACVGSGAHIFLVVVTVVIVGCFTPYVERGTVLSSGLFGYMLTSFIAGFCSANLYRRLGGEKWAWNILITALLFMGPFFLIWSVLNTVAIIYGSTAALPFSTAVVLFSCWFFVTLPLTILGGIVGRQRAIKRIEGGAAPFPCKTNKLAREIPSVLWYKSPLVQVLLSGFLPFSAIYIELHYIFLSIWGAKIYTLYSVLLIAFIMLLLVASTVSVLLAYVHLNAEDHRWWWRSYFSGGSLAVFFYLHSAYYFFSSTRMYGVLQTAFFFGYSLAVAAGIFLTMGFVTFASTYIFVNGIYSSIKSD